MFKTVMAAVGALLLAGSMSAQVAVRSGDKIAFLGDSITAQGNRPAGYVNLVIETLEANGIKAVKIPAGRGGDRSAHMLKRLEKSVIDRKPQIMILSCGVNDVWQRRNGTSLEDYKKNISAIVEKAQLAGIQVYILTATMITENPDSGFNRKLAAFNDILRSLAKEKNCEIADLNADMQKELAALHAKYPGIKGNLLTVDGVHMNPLGDRIMARGILRAFGLSDEQIAKGDPIWQKKNWNQTMSLTVQEYLKLAENAFASGKTVPDYLKMLIRQDIADKSK